MKNVFIQFWADNKPLAVLTIIMVVVMLCATVFG